MPLRPGSFRRQASGTSSCCNKDAGGAVRSLVESRVVASGVDGAAPDDDADEDDEDDEEDEVTSNTYVSTFAAMAH